MKVTISSGGKELERLLTEVAHLGKLGPLLAKTSLKAAMVATGEIRDQLQAIKGGRGGLARSFRERLVSRKGDEISAESYSNLIYAKIQNDGGTITPKSGKYLAVPLKSANVPPGKWPRHFPKEGPGALHFIPRRGNSPLLAKLRRDGSILPVFSLRTSVTLRAKHYLEEAAKRVEPEIEQILMDALDEALKPVVK